MKKYLNTTIIIGAALSVLGIIMPFIILLLTPKDESSVGIIGGASYPTYSFLWQRSIFSLITTFGIATLLLGIIFRIFNKTVSENCTIKTNLFALGLSAFSAFGLYCFVCFAISSPSKNPIALPASVIGLLISFIALITLLVLYIITYIKDKKYKRIIFDIIIIILFWLAFLKLISYTHSFLSVILWEIYT